MLDIIHIVTEYWTTINWNDPNDLDEFVHELVASELSNGEISNGLRLKASIEVGGDQKKAKILYAKLRIEQVKQQISQAVRAYQEILRQKKLEDEINRQMALKKVEDEFNASHKVCEYCSSITEKSDLVCSRCHMLFK